MLIDTHCHLNFKAFRKDLDNTLWKAREASVVRIIVPGADLETSKRAVELARSYETIYAAVGIHPHHAFQVKSLPAGQAGPKLKVKSELKKLAQNNKVVAIGECGLDYYPYKKTKEEDYKVNNELKKKQKELFQLQLELARELKLPVIFHCREAHDDIKKCLKVSRFKGLKGVFHCFSGDKKFLQWVLKQGFYVGFDGNITYDEELAKIAKVAPLKRIILETDAPYLTPEPLRSQKIFPNRPENVKIVAKFIATVKGDSFSNIARHTSQNAITLFKLN